MSCLSQDAADASTTQLDRIDRVTQGQVGIILNQPYYITKIRFYPSASGMDLMIGGIFQAGYMESIPLTDSNMGSTDANQASATENTTTLVTYIDIAEITESDLPSGGLDGRGDSRWCEIDVSLITQPRPWTYIRYLPPHTAMGNTSYTSYTGDAPVGNVSGRSVIGLSELEFYGMKSSAVGMSGKNLRDGTGTGNGTGTEASP